MVQRDRSTQIGARIPGHIYSWLQNLVESGKYPNMSQAIIGELQRSKDYSELLMILQVFGDEVNKENIEKKD